MIIGRQKELEHIDRLYHSDNSEFLVIYGRRRVGKTYLVREHLKQKSNNFIHVTGAYKGNMITQLTKFSEAFSKTYFDGIELAKPNSWDSAFKLLQQKIEQSQKRVIIFLDELPWLATSKSGLLQVLDHYWNQHWSHNKKVFLIACGSSASWLIKNIINSKGGLHNRVTGEIRLLPFNLQETKEYLLYRKIKLNSKNIVRLYMAFGGIPYYLNYVTGGKTADQNIQAILFDQNAPLKGEFNKLFTALFKQKAAYIELIKIIAKKHIGISRTEIQSTAKLSSNGGRLTIRLEQLANAGFIQTYIPWGKESGEYYKLIDEYCLFYLTWVKNDNTIRADDHWLHQSTNQAYKIWSGYAFEALCWKHINQLMKPLNIKTGGIISSWRHSPRNKQDKGAQIDLLIERNDDAITLCEIKFTDKPFSIDKKYAQTLRDKVDIFVRETKTKKKIFLALVSSAGIKANDYSKLVVDNIVSLEDLI